MLLWKGLPQNKLNSPILSRKQSSTWCSCACEVDNWLTAWIEISCAAQCNCYFALWVWYVYTAYRADFDFFIILILLNCHWNATLLPDKMLKPGHHYPRVCGSEVLCLLSWSSWARFLRPLGTDQCVCALTDGEQHTNTDDPLSTPARTAQPLSAEADPFVQGETLGDESRGHRNDLEWRSRKLAEQEVDFRGRGTDSSSWSRFRSGSCVLTSSDSECCRVPSLQSLLPPGRSNSSQMCLNHLLAGPRVRIKTRLGFKLIGKMYWFEK